MQQQQLIEDCKKNNRKAQFALYNAYSNGMYRVALRFLRDPMDAEDAMQEAFIKAFRKIDQFTAEVTFGAWLKKIVVNQCLDKIKSRKLQLVALNENVMNSVEEEDDWNVEPGIDLDLVRDCLELLPEKYKYPLLLFLLEGYDHTEIAEILKITPVASRTLVHRGKKKLQEELKKRNHETGS